MKKYIIISVIALLLLSFCVSRGDVLKVYKTYEIKSDIHALNIEIRAGDFTIEQGEKFFVESNMKNLSVSENDGVLTIVQHAKLAINYTNERLKLCIPEGAVFETVDITTGAARLTADSLSANSVKLKMGAGQVRFGCLNAYSHARIDGGAGQFSIGSGMLHNLIATLGVGELNMVSALRGECDLKLGIGESNLTLIGNSHDYKLDIIKGIGCIDIKENTTSASNGIAQCHAKIKGGIGAVNIKFQAE